MIGGKARLKQEHLDDQQLKGQYIRTVLMRENWYHTPHEKICTFRTTKVLFHKSVIEFQQNPESWHDVTVSAKRIRSIHLDVEPRYRI
jgi:hypothetical protein